MTNIGGTRDRIVNTDETGGGGGNVVVTNVPLPTVEQTGLVPEEYDYIDLGYTGDDLTSVVFKVGGAGGATVATLALTYAGGNLDTVTRT